MRTGITFQESTATHNAHGCLPARATGHVRRVQGRPGDTLVPTWGIVIVKQSPVSDVLYCLFIGKLEQKMVMRGWKEPGMAQLFPQEQLKPAHATTLPPHICPTPQWSPPTSKQKRGGNWPKSLGLFHEVISHSSIHLSNHSLLLRIIDSGSILDIWDSGDTEVNKRWSIPQKVQRWTNRYRIEW